MESFDDFLCNSKRRRHRDKDKYINWHFDCFFFTQTAWRKGGYVFIELPIIDRFCSSFMQQRKEIHEERSSWAKTKQHIAFFPHCMKGYSSFTHSIEARLNSYINRSLLADNIFTTEVIIWPTTTQSSKDMYEFHWLKSYPCPFICFTCQSPENLRCYRESAENSRTAGDFSIDMLLIWHLVAQADLVDRS